jgi:hypothetical protein
LAKSWSIREPVPEAPAYFPLASNHFAMQSRSMKTDQATEALQTIRTLMERSTLYRRALAPIMTSVGCLGILAAIIGWLLHVEAQTTFIAYWFGVALLGLTGSLLLVRRQAIKTSEPFWSPPTRRVAQALLPALTIGFLVGAWLWLSMFVDDTSIGGSTNAAGASRFHGWLAAIWAILYGCGLHAAGFFTSRGLRHFGWLFIAAGNMLLAWLIYINRSQTPGFPWWQSHMLMGALFGGLQLAYGIYLFITGEEQNEL